MQLVHKCQTQSATFVSHPTGAGWEMLLSQSPHHPMQTPAGRTEHGVLEEEWPRSCLLLMKILELGFNTDLPCLEGGHSAVLRCFGREAVH